MYTGPLTGELVWSQAKLRLQMKKRKTRRGGNKDVYPVISTLQYEGAHAVKTMDVNNERAHIKTVSMQCDKCGRRYSRYDFLQKHVSNCNGSKMSQTVLGRVCRMAFEMLPNSELSLYTTKMKIRKR